MLALLTPPTKTRSPPARDPAPSVPFLLFCFTTEKGFLNVSWLVDGYIDWWEAGRLTGRIQCGMYELG